MVFITTQERKFYRKNRRIFVHAFTTIFPQFQKKVHVFVTGRY